MAKKSADSPGGGRRGPVFEEALGELESIVSVLEEGEVSLDELLERYGRGMELVQWCQQRLEAARQRVEQLAIPVDGGAEGSDEDASEGDDDSEIRLL